MTSPFLEAPASSWVASNTLAFALRDRFPVSPGHTLVIPRRLIATWFDATPDERTALFALVDEVKSQLDAELHPDGYNIGINAGEAAGQTVMHLHVHVIPRFRGDVDDPRGGVRHVIPGKGNYLAARPAPLATGGTDDPLLEHLVPLFARATDIAILAAFVQESGLDQLERHVFSALERGARIRLITGDYLHITQATALADLLGSSRGASRSLPAGARERAQAIVDMLLRRAGSFVDGEGKRCRIVGRAPDGGLRIDGGPAGFAERTVSLTDLAWVLVARDDAQENGGLLDEQRVNRVRYLEGTPKASTRWIDTGWALLLMMAADSEKG
ncbi:HIT domain-containing protein [Sorangium sp. So ce1078]|uniref:HIT domain-containing protein n=1 Tax=Sorangium sp. So ce1078 TaxID=3133329 RepID=UPI003F5E40BB